MNELIMTLHQSLAHVKNELAKQETYYALEPNNDGRIALSNLRDAKESIERAIEYVDEATNSNVWRVYNANGTRRL